MCKAFSCIATRKKVYWKIGLDSHEDIKDKFKLNDNSDKLVPIEIIPVEGYMNMKNPKKYPKAWKFTFDDNCPDWWKQSHEKRCWKALELWYKEINKIIDWKYIKSIKNPLETKPKKMTIKHIKSLKRWKEANDSVCDTVWDSVWDSVRDSVRDSVGASVGASVWDSVGHSVCDTVWDSVCDSVGRSVWDSAGASVGASAGAYASYGFSINKWKHITHKKGEYPYKCLVDLWKDGLVPSFDGKTWRIHAGRKAKIILEISESDLAKKKPEDILKLLE